MCLAVPLRIAEIDGKNAIGERDGVQRKIRLDFIADPKVGEYVIVHAGFAIERLSREQAEEVLKAFREVEEAIRGLENREYFK